MLALTCEERERGSVLVREQLVTAWFEKAGRAWLHALDHVCANKKEESKYSVQPDNGTNDDGVCVYPPSTSFCILNLINS